MLNKFLAMFEAGYDMEPEYDTSKDLTDEEIETRKKNIANIASGMKCNVPDDILDAMAANTPYEIDDDHTVSKWLLIMWISDIAYQIDHELKHIKSESIKYLPMIPLGKLRQGYFCISGKDGICLIYNEGEIKSIWKPLDESISLMTEADEAPPEIPDAPEIATPADDVSDEPDSDPADNSPPTLDETGDISADDTTMDDSSDGSSEGDNNEEELTLDEKGEIFAKVKIIKDFRSLYDKIDDTLELIDKIDLVQTGNSIRSTDITEIKDDLSSLMNDIYSTIVYEFQLQYRNLKVKLVEYSSRYVLLTKRIVSLIRKDQKSQENT